MAFIALELLARNERTGVRSQRGAMEPSLWPSLIRTLRRPSSTDKLIEG